LGVGAACSGANRQECAFAVIRPGEELLEFPLIEFLDQLGGFFLGFVEEGFVGFESQDFEGGFGVGEEGLPPIEAVAVGFVVVEFLEGGLGGGLVVPECGLGGDLFEVGDFGVEGGEVKDSPEFYPGDR
jgi:hypothetical protein